jgi:hypothetical protein
MPTIAALHQYLKRNPHYIGTFLKDICHIWWWRLLRQPIVVLTTESGGLGDYLWFRSYYSLIRKHYATRKSRLIVIGMRQWVPLVYDWNCEPQTDHFDIYRSFESPDNPLKVESVFFQLFKADVYVDFRARHLKQLVKTNEHYYGLGFREMKQYYESANNAVISQWFRLPDGFRHKPPLLPISDLKRQGELQKPYVVVVEGGNTQGKLSDKQISDIVNLIIPKGYNVFYNGDYKRLLSILNSQLSTLNSQIIDGYQYPLNEYPTIVAKSQFVVTVNTFIYHLAIQLEKPVVVISANEYESIKLDASFQEIVFNKELQQAYEKQMLSSYQPIKAIKLKDIDSESIIKAVQQIDKYF